VTLVTSRIVVAIERTIVVLFVSIVREKIYYKVFIRRIYNKCSFDKRANKQILFED